MKLLTILPALVLLSCLQNSMVERKISIKPIGWEFPLANETIFKDSAFNSRGEVIVDIPSDGPSLKLFTIQDSSFGSFGAYLRKDSLKFNDWKESHNEDSNWYFEQLGKLSQLQLLETKYYSITIDTVNFLVQYVKCIIKGNLDTTYVYHFYGKLNDVELDMSVEYDKSLIGKKYMNIINNSKFVD